MTSSALILTAAVVALLAGVAAVLIVALLGVSIL
jgi:hypothetical protein